MTSLISAPHFTETTQKLRNFFISRGFQEVHTQNRLSILAACEDPETVACYTYANNLWPLPQTGQMWLEYELLNAPQTPGFFCLSTSYRQEPHPLPGRHELIFPMFEFELPGTFQDLKNMLYDLIVFLDFSTKSQVRSETYASWCKIMDAASLGTDEEAKMAEKWPGTPCFITDFPNHTSPFWNMAQTGEGTAAKIDVILEGQETIGSAARSCNPDEMREMFHTISEGHYAKLLFETFGRKRVEKELEDFLSLPFFPRVGGGIGLTRLMRAHNISQVRNQRLKSAS